LCFTLIFITFVDKTIAVKYLFVIAISTLLLVSCRMRFSTEKGSGVLESKEKILGTISIVEVSGNFKVKIIPSDEHRVIVETDDNLHRFLRIEEDDNRLRVGVKNNARLKPSKPIILKVYMQEVKRVELAGSCELESEGLLKHDDHMDITMAGSSKANVEVDAPSINVSMAGSGKVKARGKTRNLKIKIAGSGDFSGSELLSESTEISISGSGDASVFSSVDLKVSIAGSGKVLYGGNPANVKKSIAGSGVVKPID
jgi:hypothetical protein